MQESSLESRVTRLKGLIERAFAGRQRPAEMVSEPVLQDDSDVDDARWFAARDWRKLMWEDWRVRWCGVGHFTPEAFAYLLPSLMCVSLQRPDDSLMPVDYVIGWLDLSPDMLGIHDELIDRFSLLSDAEFEVFQEWLLVLSDFGQYGVTTSGEGDELGRAFQAICWIQARLRSVTEAEM